MILAVGLACAPDQVDARASSGGSRGSRSYSAPASSRPNQPSVAPPAGRGVAQAAPGPSVVSRVMSFALGGFVASVVFRAFGLGGDWTIGLLDILLLVGAAFLLLAYLRDRDANAEPIVVGTRKSR